MRPLRSTATVWLVRLSGGDAQRPLFHYRDFTNQNRNQRFVWGFKQSAINIVLLFVL